MQLTLTQQYPVVLNQFRLRPDSGGNGQWRGGDGVIREVIFTEQCHASVLSQRRVYSPYGMAGGDDASRGINYLGRKMKDDSIRWINLGGSKEVDLHAGDRIMLCTPGGGGYGKPGGTNTLTTNRDATGKKQYSAPIPRANGSLREYESNQLASN